MMNKRSLVVRRPPTSLAATLRADVDGKPFYPRQFEGADENRGFEFSTGVWESLLKRCLWCQSETLRTSRSRILHKDTAAKS